MPTNHDAANDLDRPGRDESRQADVAEADLGAVAHRSMPAVDRESAPFGLPVLAELPDLACSSNSRSQTRLCVVPSWDCGGC